MLEIILPNKAQFDTMNMHLANIALPTATSITIADAGNLITATNVEGALQEDRTLINTLDADVGDKSTLTTNVKTNLVNAINEHVTDTAKHNTKCGISFYIDGVLSAETNACKIIVPLGISLLITSVTLSVDVTPTIALVVDINKNGATIFTTQANRPTIATGNVVTTSLTPDIALIGAGDIISIDIDGGNGENLAVTLNCEVV